MANMGLVGTCLDGGDSGANPGVCLQVEAVAFIAAAFLLSKIREGA